MLSWKTILGSLLSVDEERRVLEDKMTDYTLSQKIKANYDYFSEYTTDIHSLVDKLTRKNLLTNTSKDRILNETDNPNDQLKAAQLYYIVAKSKEPETLGELVECLLETGNYKVAFRLNPQALTKYFISEAGGSRTKDIEFQDFHKKYLTHLEIQDSTIDLGSFVQNISELTELEEIRLQNVRADRVRDCEYGSSFEAIQHPALLPKLVHFECSLWFESRDEERYGQFIWPQEIYNLDPNRLIFFRKGANEKLDTLEDRLRSYFGLKYLELTVNNHVLVLAVRDQNLAIAPTSDGRTGKYFLPPNVLTELKALFQNDKSALKEIIWNLPRALVNSEDLRALQSSICERNQVLQLRLLMTLLTWVNPQVLGRIGKDARMTAILGKTMLTATQNPTSSLIPTLEQSSVLTHVHFKNIQVKREAFPFPEAFKNCTYLQSLIMENIRVDHEAQFYTHIHLANLRKFHLSHNVNLDEENMNIVKYLRQSRGGDWRELLFSEQNLHYSDEYLDGRRLLTADFQLILSGYILAFTDANHRLHVISAEANNRDIGDKEEDCPNIEHCCDQTVNLSSLIEHLRQNKFFNKQEEAALQNCPDDLKTRLLFSIQAFTLRETSIFVDCLLATGNKAVVHLFCPPSLQVHHTPFGGVATYRQPFLTHLLLNDVSVDWETLPSMLAPCLALESLKMEKVSMRHTESIGGRCFLPGLKTFSVNGSIWLDTAADLKALLFFDRTQAWKMDQLWLLGTDITVVTHGVTNLIVDHAKAELLVKGFQHSADDILKSVSVNLTKLTLASVQLKMGGYVPKVQTLKALSLNQFEVANLDGFLRSCSQIKDLTLGFPVNMSFQNSWHQVEDLRKLDLSTLPRSMESLTLLTTQLTLSSKTKKKGAGPILVNNLFLWGTEMSKKIERLEKHLEAVNCFLFEHGRSVLKKGPTSTKLLSGILSSSKTKRVFYGRVDSDAYNKKFVTFLKKLGLKGDERGFVLTRSSAGQWTTEVVTQNKLNEALELHIQKPLEG